MSQPITSRQIDAFVRSVLPSEAGQFLLLLGSFLLYISREARWLPHSFDAAGTWDRFRWKLIARGLSLPLAAVGAAGWHVALLKSARPARRLLLWAIVPATATILAIAFLSAFQIVLPLDPSYSSVLERTLARPHVLSDFSHVFVAMGLGMRLALAGLALVLCVFVLLLKGKISLPVSIGTAEEGSALMLNSAAEIENQQKLMRFVWVMISLPILTAFSAFPFSLVGVIRPSFLHSSLLVWEEDLLYSVALLALVLFAIGKESRGQIFEYLRVPRLNYLLLGIAIPAAVAYLWPLIDYLHHEIFWSTNLRGTSFSPAMAEYLKPPTIASLHYLFGALVEEIAWRGYLQPRFIRRYGLVRGVFLVGVVWGAFHFYFDFNGAYSWVWVGKEIAIRLVGTVALSYSMAWLAIRSKSILPVTLLHAAHNAGLQIPLDTFVGFNWIRNLAYLVIGYLLFRYFPPTSEETESELGQPSPDTTPEPTPSEL